MFNSSPNDKEWKDEWEDVPYGTTGDWSPSTPLEPGEYRGRWNGTSACSTPCSWVNPDLTFAEKPLGHAELQQEWDQNPDTMELG